MKKLLLVFTLITLLSPKAFAEYNGWFAALQIETKTGQEFTRHVYVVSAYFDNDSVNNQNYLLQKIDELDYFPDGKVTYYKDRLSYEYLSYGGEEKVKIYSLINEDSISIAEIAKVKILERIDFGYLLGVSSGHTLKDKIWMDQDPEQTLNEGGYFCDWQIFIHQKTKETDRIVEALTAYNKAFEAKRNTLEEDFKYSDGEDREQIKREIEKLEEEIDAEKDELIARFHKHKVVVIQFCSC